MPSPPERVGEHNPLRSRAAPSTSVRRVAGGQEPLASHPAGSGGAVPADALAANPVRSAARAVAGGAPATDAFGARYGTVDARAGPSPSAVGNSAADPPEAGPSGFPQLVGPTATGDAGVGLSGQPPRAATSIEGQLGRYPAGTSGGGSPAAHAPSSGPREPAPFQLDRQTPTSSIPQPSGRYRPGSTSTLGSIPSPSKAGTAQLAPQSERIGSAQGDPARNGTGQPGSRALEGPQTPQLTIQKFAPPEIQVGKPAKFQVKVINTGQIAAADVEIRDEIPKQTQLIATRPRAQRGVRGELVWELGTMQPGQEETVEVELMPTAEGEIGSVATVHLGAAASARAVATKPELEIEVACPNRVVIGETITLAITISNPGSGVATGVILEEHVPAGLQHAAGTELEYDVGTLKPKESRKLELTLTAARPGPFANLLVARGDASLRTEARQELAIVAPQLDLAMSGPSRRYLEREATYTVSLSNPGTAPAHDVELVAQLPPGLKFVSADNQGHYDEATRTVHWRLAELPVQATGSVTLTTMPVEAGKKTIRVAGAAAKVAPVEKEQPIQIEGIAAILFQVVDVDDPIEKGGETAYEIRVLNQGSKAATNVRIEALIPPEMRVVAAEGPSRHLIDGNRVRFEGLARLAPKADTTYRVRVQGLQPGDLRIRVQLLTDEMQSPVVKEESTRVYSDE